MLKLYVIIRNEQQTLQLYAFSNFVVCVLFRVESALFKATIAATTTA
jgi:hypothetical protein